MTQQRTIKLATFLPMTLKYESAFREASLNIHQHSYVLVTKLRWRQA